MTFDNKSAYLYKKKISSSFSVNKGSISTLVISKLKGQAYIENFLQFSNKTVVFSLFFAKVFFPTTFSLHITLRVEKDLSLPYQ